jgi:PASTA domain
MSTKWVVTTPSDHVELDEARQGQSTFTVTNPTARVDRVVFDIVPQDGADPAWFTVDEPQRRVPAGGSVSYVMKTAIPPTAKPGGYSVQGRAYSADSAPEEDSVLSSRVAVEVKAAEAPPPRKRFPWWIIVVAALVVVVLVVVLVLVFASGGKPASTPSPSAPPASGQVTMPDLSNQTGQQATTNVVAFGLSVGTVRHVLDNRPDRVVYQSVAGGAKVAAGTRVDLVVTTALAKPVLTAPAEGASLKRAQVSAQVAPVPTTPSAGASQAAPSPSTAPADVLAWTDSDTFVKRWQVTIQQQACATTLGGSFECGNPGVTVVQVQVDRPAYTPILTWITDVATRHFIARVSNVFTITIQAVDDFGYVGPPSDPHTITVI